jgi:transcriptional regulator GlxA family with amidase domain
MKQIALLVLNDAVSAAVADPCILFNGVNDFLKQAGRPPLFKLHLVGLTKTVKLHNGIFTVHADTLLKNMKKADLVIIPAMGGDLKSAIKKNREFIPWIVKQSKKGAEVASLCVGSFLLASYWNLLLHLFEKYAGREMAIMTSKIYALEIGRKSQSPFIMFNGQKEHVDEPIKDAQNYIESKVSEKISVGDLALRFSIGRRHFERRFKKATNNTPVEYIQRVKIEAAKKHFETSRKNVNEVMYDVGYSDTKAFRTMFKKITGLSPLDYKNRYNMQF